MMKAPQENEVVLNNRLGRTSFCVLFMTAQFVQKNGCEYDTQFLFHPLHPLGKLLESKTLFPGKVGKILLSACNDKCLVLHEIDKQNITGLKLPYIWCCRTSRSA